MAYVINGNLYFQGGSNPPVQLTHSRDDWQPLFTNDAEKIVFFRGRTPHELYSINTDGSQEQELITNSMLIALDLGYDETTGVQSLSFLPNTHLLLFNTGKVDLYHPQETGPSISNEDLFLVDMDTNKINVLLPPGKEEGFRVSPDGNLVAIQTKGHIDVIEINGKMIYRNLVTYTPTHPYDLKPNFFWGSDSAELIVALPAREIYDLSGPEAYSIWRYSINGSAKAQLSFNPPPLDSCCASPDGNWFLYNYGYYPGKTSDKITSGLYLGNLRDGSTQLYVQYSQLFSWNPDSIHFIFGDGQEIFLGAVSEQAKFIVKGRFMGWLDDNLFLYYSFDNDTLFVGDIRKTGIPIFTNMPIGLPLEGRNFFTFVFLDYATVR